MNFAAFPLVHVMNWFINLRTGVKLLLGFGVIILLTGVVAALAHLEVEEIARAHEISSRAEGLENNLNEARAVVLTMLATRDNREWRALAAMARNDSQEGRQLISQIRDLVRGNAEMLGTLEQFEALYAKLTEDQDTVTLPLVLAGNLEEARSGSLTTQHQRYLELRDLSQRLGAQARTLSRHTADRADASFLIMGVVTVLVAGLVVWLLNRTIAVPLRDITLTAERIASGELPAGDLVMHRSDEVGLLGQAFARMTGRLRDISGVASQIAKGDLRVSAQPLSERDVLGLAFQRMVENLRQLIGELREGINVLSASAAQISASSSELAASAMQTAAAVAETSVTVEEVRQTAQVSSQKARSVSDSAQRVASVSEAGRQSTDETVAVMSLIEQQMDSIAQSMARLSEQSQAVGQIVSTVEDLSGQSKLLAVNASIEAAKAAEHGRGFAVVAQEVRSMAEQSKQATVRVRALLGEIQQATSAAVLATEQGSHAVEGGVRQSEKAGQSIQALTNSVSEAAQAAIQIAASSQQQLVGVDQVASAMESIKQASNQNVEGAKQLEAATRTIRGLGEKLKELTAAYRA
jgi:methyl-accepting chemotaxis protein